MYLLKLSLRPWRISFFSQIFSAIAVGFLLFLVAFLFWMQQGLKPVVARLKGEQVLTAYLQAQVAEGSEKQIVDQIRTSLGAHEEADVRFVGTREFLEQLKNHYPDLGKELEDLGSESTLVIPRYVSITGMLPDTAQEVVRGVRGVESVESSKDRYRHVVGAFSALRWVARLLMLGICLALLTGLIHLSKMNTYLHRDALSLLKLWGAGGMALRAPGTISGMMVGLAGGALSALVWLTGGAWLASHVRALSPMLSQMPVPETTLALALVLLAALMGTLAGALGSMTAAATRNPGRS